MTGADGPVGRRHWIDMIGDGGRWTDPVGLRLEARNLSSAAISLLAEFALENPSPGGTWSAEVRTEEGRVVLTATLTSTYHR